MNYGQFKDPLCYLCLPADVVAFRFLIQEVTGSNTAILSVINISWIRCKRSVKTQLSPCPQNAVILLIFQPHKNDKPKVCKSVKEIVITVWFSNVKKGICGNFKKFSAAVVKYCTEFMNLVLFEISTNFYQIIKIIYKEIGIMILLTHKFKNYNNHIMTPSVRLDLLTIFFPYYWLVLLSTNMGIAKGRKGKWPVIGREGKWSVNSVE